MDLTIIDRRKAGKGKNIGNVERFKRRHYKRLKEAAEDALREDDIGDIKGRDVHIPKKDLSEPVFRHGKGGVRETVHPGNKDYYKGDKIPRPKDDGRRSSGSGGEDETDDFTYHLSKNDILDILFDDLELPNMLKRYLLGDDDFKFKSAGITSTGSPNNLHVVRSFREAIGRRIALDAPKKRRLNILCDAMNLAATPDEYIALQREIDIAKALPNAAYIDPIDLRYRNRVKVPIPTHKAVVFRLMDASGSMGEDKKADAKFFFTLLKMFLDKDYENVEVINIRYHDRAYECDDKQFIYGKDTGGTNVSNALILMKEIIKERYSSGEWNIYGALASDGDTGTITDEYRTSELMPEIMDLCQHFFYIELDNEEKELGTLFKTVIGDNPNFSMQREVVRSNLIKVFRGFLQKKGMDIDSRRPAHFAEDFAP